MISELGLQIETPVQTQAIPSILSGENVLIVSPTGSGKTEAALLPILEKIRLISDRKGIKAIYITPLRALNRDLLRRVQSWAKQLGLTSEVRHGDTTPSTRRKQSLSPPDIMITTPETLQAILVGSRLRTHLKELRYIVVDEIHHLARDRRGSQLSFGLERLRIAVGRDFQRIGLTATVANTKEIGEFLCGQGRAFKIVDTSETRRPTVFNIEFPKPEKEDELQARQLFISPQILARLKRIADLVAGHDQTLIFVNSRTVAEQLCSRLDALGTRVGVHHGSLPKEERERREYEFRLGRVKALVCTSTMELGIDIGSVDLVIQYMSPRQINSLVQRVGRSGHEISRTSEGVMIAISAEDALECKGISEEALARHYDSLLIPKSPLDVLAHQVAGLLLEYSQIGISQVMSIARCSFTFKDLTLNDLLSVARYMAKLGLLSIEGEKLVRRSRCRDYYLQNLSTIRDERRYNVIDVSSQEKIGILGEEFVFLHAEVGTRFIIRGRGWQIESIQEQTVYVIPIEDLSAAIPGWDGELIPIPKSVAQKVGHLRANLELAISKSEGSERILSGMEKFARDSVADEVLRQSETSVVPTDKRVVVEGFKNYLVIHTSAGDRINATLGELFEERLLRVGGIARNWWSDGHRILIELSSEEFEIKEMCDLLFNFDSTVSGFIDAVLRKHFPFGYDMKSVAERFGALKRGRMLSGESLKELGIKFRFTPIYDETIREAYERRVDIRGAVDFLRACNKGDVELRSIRSTNPSALAMYILSRYAEPEDYISGSSAIESMKKNVEKEIVSLLCLDCVMLKEFQRVGDLEERPQCEKCGSKLLSVLTHSGRYAKSLLLKRREHLVLTPEDMDFLAKLRRSADVVLSYGKRGVIAQTVYGIGPQMAARVLSRMHESEASFYTDLVAAKLKFIKTKRYWN